MTKVHLIAGLTPPLKQLLDAGGIRSVEELAGQEPVALCQRLALLNRSLPGAGAPPAAEDVERWVRQARELVRAAAERAPLEVSRVPPAAAPAPAAPTSAERVAKAAPVAVRPVGAAAEPVRLRPADAPSKEAPRPQFRDFQAYEAGETGVAPLPRKAAEDEDEVEAALLRARQKPGGPVPRVVRRGVPHPRPYFLVFCSLIVLISRLLLLAVVVGTPVVLWFAFFVGDVSHLWSFLWIIAAWVVSGIFYLLFALRARCRVCTNQIFWSKRCFKNSKAHRLPGLGLVGSLALHALIFRWFRCMYCGTAIRLKFVADPERSK